MKVYIIFWADSFDDWRLVKVFSSKEKAEDYMKGLKSKGCWIVEEDVK